MAEGTGFTPDRWGFADPPSHLSEPSTQSRKAYDLIRADVIGGRLAPSSKLLTDRTTQRYGIGAGPIREAMTRLAAEGLLSCEGQKGFRVASATPAELVDVGRARLQLEIWAITDAIGNGSGDWEISLMNAFHRLQQSISAPPAEQDADAEDHELAHRAFHLALLNGCNSRWLLHFCERIYDQTERYRRLFTGRSGTPHRCIADHENIFYAALVRDTPTCTTLLARHIIVETRRTLADMVAAGAPYDPPVDAVLAEEAAKWGVEAD